SNARTVIVRNLAAFEAAYGMGVNVAGVYSGALDDGGERIRLEDSTGATIVDFEYKDSWYGITDGGGFSLVRNSGATSEKDGWRASDMAGGLPGASDTSSLPIPGSVVINEVLAHSDDTDPDWIELHNTTGSAIDIGNWYLSDNDADLKKYKIAGGTMLPANGYLVFYQDTDFGSAGDPGSATQFALSETGETVYLSSGSGGTLTGYRDQEDFGASDTNIAFGRYEKSTGTFNFIAMASNTPGAANAGHKVWPIIIREFMYNPGTIDEEYIELDNRSGSTVTLDDGSGNAWKFTDGIEYYFPLGTTIPSGDFLIVAKDITAFNAAYSPPGGVPVLGPYSGALDNGGEKLEIGKPGDIDSNGVLQYVRIDRVVYDDVAPWPTTPDGGGKALKRTTLFAYGNDVANWNPVNPAPGS
ncbi:MAG: lamin tail domain-containing protein, partial [Candidatus Hydrogenedentota bacterium]